MTWRAEPSRSLRKTAWRDIGGTRTTNRRKSVKAVGLEPTSYGLEVLQFDPTENFVSR
jgi:hypothetical protein